MSKFSGGVRVTSPEQYGKNLEALAGGIVRGKKKEDNQKTPMAKPVAQSILMQLR